MSLPVRDPVQPPVRPPVLPAVAEPTVVPTWLIAVAIVSGLAVLGALGFVVVHVSSVAAAQPVGVAAPVPQVGPTVPVETPSTPRPVTTGVNPAWAARVGAEAGIPVPAMLAYGDAELTLDHQQPSCHLSWNTLAGIGWIESQNGTIGGRTLESNGYSSTPVIGPALDGTKFAAIHSTPLSASWHGDSVWEHAVGPMQFIASTWEKWGVDGDHDGTANPLDLNDAALTTAHYLCADGHDLATATGWSAAIHSYDHDDQYVLNVLSAANTYAARSTGR